MRKPLSLNLFFLGIARYFSIIKLSFTPLHSKKEESEIEREGCQFFKFG